MTAPLRSRRAWATTISLAFACFGAAAGTTSGSFTLQIILTPVNAPVGGGGAAEGTPPMPVPGGVAGPVPVLVPDTGAALPVIRPPVDSAQRPVETPPLTEQPPAVPASISAGRLCTSQTLSSASGALVRVVCSTGQFVSIEPVAGQPIAGTHGGAYRFLSHQKPETSPSLQPSSVHGGLWTSGASQLLSGSFQGATVAVFNQEMLISF